MAGGDAFPESKATVKLIDYVHLLLRLRIHAVVPSLASLRRYDYFTVYEVRVSHDISDVAV